MAKQSIFGRIAQLTRANINSLLDQAEDPSKMLDQMVRDYTNSIAEAEEAVATTIGNLRLLEQDHAEDGDPERHEGQHADDDVDRPPRTIGKQHKCRCQRPTDNERNADQPQFEGPDPHARKSSRGTLTDPIDG